MTSNLAISLDQDCDIVNSVNAEDFTFHDMSLGFKTHDNSFQKTNPMAFSSRGDKPRDHCVIDHNNCRDQRLYTNTAIYRV